MEDITVSTPARHDFLHVFRSVIASVAAVLSFPYDGIDDLRIAVDEACSHLLTVPSIGGSLSMQIRPSPQAIEVIASIDAETDDWPRPGAGAAMTRQVLSALADSAQFERTERGPAIRFVKQLVP